MLVPSTLRIVQAPQVRIVLVVRSALPSAASGCVPWIYPVSHASIVKAKYCWLATDRLSVVYPVAPAGPNPLAALAGQACPGQFTRVQNRST
jgi:hypothetical protein